jgi:hypothetical protein
MALISEYSFNEGSGLTSRDWTGTYDLTASNSTTSWDAGGHTGAGAKIKHRGNVGPNATQADCTIMMWVKRTSNWTNNRWAAFFANSTQNILLETRSNAYTINAHFGTDDSTATTTLGLDTWVHVAVTQTGGTSHQIFINGISEGTPGTGNATLNFGSDADWTVAADLISVPAEDNDFLGIVDDLRIFDTVLTAGEITTYMNTPAGPQPATSTPLMWVAGA